MANKEEVTFELQALTGTRWETQGVYTAAEEKRALADAKALERVSTIKQVKVVKEFFDPVSNKTRVFTVFESARKPDPSQKASSAPQKSAVHVRKPQPVAAPRKSSAPPRSGKGGKGGKASGGPSASLSEEGLSAPETGNGKGKRVSLMSAFLQTMLSLVAAAVAAIAVTQLANMAMRDTHSIGFMNRNDFLILVFIGVFAITALALIARILTRLKDMAPPSLPLVPSRPAPPHRPKPAPKPRKRSGKPHVPQVEEDEPAKAAEPESEPEPEPAPEPEAEEEEEEEEEPGPDLASNLIAMNAFTADVLDVVKGEDGKPDAHVVFGLVLFLVGAVHGLRSRNKLNDADYGRVMNKTLGTLDMPKDRIEHFTAHTDEYLVANARYSQMFQQGRNAMVSYLDDNAGPRGALADALDAWEKPKGQAKGGADQPITVLFTDIAGSTAMTQQLGDEGAQEVVRAHNDIVRDAIKTFGGKEIKHTGDGIMASFPSAAQGVEAAQDMQRHTLKHNAAHPERPLGLKVGLNAGEPISEDDDLFGTTVQLAARIVDKAASGQILVSGSVQGLSQGKNLKFHRFADLEMKGFDESVIVYEAVWQDEAQQAQPEQAQQAPAQQTPAQQTPPTQTQAPQATPPQQATPDAQPAASPDKTAATPATPPQGETQPVDIKTETGTDSAADQKEGSNAGANGGKPPHTGT